MVRKAHQEDGERWRTMTELAAFREHDRITDGFTTALREGRCRRTTRFSRDVGSTVGVLKPLAGPWNFEILFVLYMHGPVRFLALRRTLGSVSSRVLTDKLRALAAEGFVERREQGRAVAYALSRRGATVARHLHPVVFYLRNAPSIEAPRTPARASPDMSTSQGRIHGK